MTATAVAILALLPYNLVVHGQRIATVDGNVAVNVPAGRSFSVSCPETGQAGCAVECSGPGVEVINGECVPSSNFAPAEQVNQLRESFESQLLDLSSRLQNLSSALLQQQANRGSDVSVIVVGMHISDVCTFGNCTVSLATKPMGTSVALVKDIPIYRCRFTSEHLAEPLMSEPVASLDGLTVTCAVPRASYPGGLDTPHLEVFVDLIEGNSNHISWGHGANGDADVVSASFLKSPGAPWIGLTDNVIYYKHTVPNGNSDSIQFTIMDLDTDLANVSVQLRTTLSASIRRNGDTDQFVITISNINDNSAQYSRDITVIATDNAGMSSNATLTVTFIGTLTANILPAGATVQTVSRFQNMEYDIGVPSYGNDIRNFRATQMTHTITTLRHNSKILVQTQFVMAAHSGSHTYVDIWRKIGNGPFVSLAIERFGNDADGLMSEHPAGSTSTNYEQAQHPFVLDEPQQPAGTQIEYKVYVGLWSGSTITFGGHRNGNNNGRSPEHMLIEEIADGNCYLGSTPTNCLDRLMMPLGSPIQTVATYANMNYNIYTPHYGNSINNFRPTRMTVAITTLEGNSSIFVQSQFTMAGYTTSHKYVDIWRKIGEDGDFESLSRLIGGPTADGLVSEHSMGSTSAQYEQAKYPFVLDQPNVPAGTLIEYKIYVGTWGNSWTTFGGHRSNNENGNSPELFIARELLGATSLPEGVTRIPARDAPAGSIVSTSTRMQNLQYDVGTPHYGNNINNLRATSMTFTVQTQRANSKISVRTQMVMAQHQGSHLYLDIWRKIGDGSFQSLSRQLGGNSADGLVSEHHPGSTNAWYEQGKWAFVLDNPRQPAGTRIEYRVYVGKWGGGSITIGSHRNNNNNGNSPELFVVQEVAV